MSTRRLRVRWTRPNRHWEGDGWVSDGPDFEYEGEVLAYVARENVTYAIVFMGLRRPLEQVDIEDLTVLRDLDTV